MNKRWIALAAAGGLAAGLAVAGVALFVDVDRLASHYPGSAPVASDGVEASVEHKQFSREAEYRTEDDWLVVMRWYVDALNIQPGSSTNLQISGECAFLMQARQDWRLSHSITVLICSASPGSSIVVNEEVRWWP